MSSFIHSVSLMLQAKGEDVNHCVFMRIICSVKTYYFTMKIPLGMIKMKKKG